MLQVRKYGELYAQTRLETLDCLDKLSDLDTHDDLKSKLLFSVIVVSTFFYFFFQYTCIKLTRYFQLSFRSVQSTVETKRDQVRRILQLPPSSSSSSSETETSAAREMETAVTAYLRRATDTFDLSKNVEV